MYSGYILSDFMWYQMYLDFNILTTEFCCYKANRAAGKVNFVVTLLNIHHNENVTNKKICTLSELQVL